MFNLIKIVKFQISYCIIYVIVFCITFLPLASYCYEPVQTITITKEDILNAKAAPSEVIFSPSDLKAIETMEKRHFPRTYPEFSDSQRLKNLEFELFGRVWQYSPKDTRIKKLKIASSNVMLSGVSLPARFSNKKIAKRMANDSMDIRRKNDVGLIDGFLRLINPELYEQYVQTSEKIYKREF